MGFGIGFRINFYHVDFIMAAVVAISSFSFVAVCVASYCVPIAIVVTLGRNYFCNNVATRRTGLFFQSIFFAGCLLYNYIFAIGVFCGSNLFGYRFTATLTYAGSFTNLGTSGFFCYCEVTVGMA